MFRGRLSEWFSGQSSGPFSDRRKGRNCRGAVSDFLAPISKPRGKQRPYYGPVLATTVQNLCEGLQKSKRGRENWTTIWSLFFRIWSSGSIFLGSKNKPAQQYWAIVKFANRSEAKNLVGATRGPPNQAIQSIKYNTFCPPESVAPEIVIINIIEQKSGGHRVRRAQSIAFYRMDSSFWWPPLLVNRVLPLRTIQSLVFRKVRDVFFVSARHWWVPTSIKLVLALVWFWLGLVRLVWAVLGWFEFVWGALDWLWFVWPGLRLFGMGLFGLDRFVLVWVGVCWLGLVWACFGWCGLVCASFGLFGLVSVCLGLFGLARAGLNWFGWVRVRSGQFQLVWAVSGRFWLFVMDLVWFGLVWAGLGWLGLAWIGIGSKGSGTFY